MLEVPAEKRSALVIATGTYADADLAQLRAPARDAEDLAAVLGDPRLGQFEVTSLLDRSARDIRVGVEDFLASRATDELLVVYLSCHGVRDAPGRLYFAAADTDKSHLSSTGVGSRWLLDRLDECRTRRQVLILDCCFSGAFTDPRRKGETDGELRRLLVGHGRGRVVLTASRAGEYSYEGQALPGAEITGSVFTTGLVEGLRTGGADGDHDGLISVEDAYDYAYTYVQAYGAAQTPQRWTYGAEGKIWLARNPTSRSKANGEGEGTSAFTPQTPKPTAPPATLGTPSSRERESGRQDEAGRTGTRNHRPPGLVTPSVAGPRTTVKASRVLVAMNYGGYALIVTCIVFGTWGGVYGLFNPGKPVLSIGSLVIEDNNRFTNAMIGGGTGCSLGMVTFLLGLVVGMFGKSDEITADSTGLTFARARRGQGPLTYQVRWAAIRSIDVVEVPNLLLQDHHAVVVDFLPENTPSLQWRELHSISRDKSGRYRIYRNAWYRPSSVQPTRLIRMLRLHAPQLYNDPEKIPDP